jgi:GT2 family glycosyltransferase
MAEQDYPSLRTVVVDDGSSDGTNEFLATCPTEKVHVIRGDGSLWWGGAMNLGMRFVFGVAEDCDYLLMLNDDVRIGPVYVSTLVDDSVVNNGAVVGSGQRDEASGALLGSGYEVDYKRMVFRPIHAQAVAIAVDALPGRGTLFPVRIARRAGYIHKLLPHHFGDIEYTARVKESGNLLLVSSRAEVTTATASGQSTERRSTISKKWFGHRSPDNLGHRLIFFLARGPLSLRILAIPRFMLRTLTKLVRSSN